MKSRMNLFNLLLLVSATVLVSSCVKERSGATGWAYNDSANGGFEKAAYLEQETGPGLVLVEGGTFSMGQVEDDLMFQNDNFARRVTVSSFYMDETEVTNFFWLEYMYWLRRVYGDSYPEIVERALPDTLVWREKMEYNEPYVDYYLRHPAYRDYPVVGVNWLQSSDFCTWRTDRVNELLLIREGLMVHSPTGQVDEEHFNTDAYFAGQYEGERELNGLIDYNPNGSGYRNVKMEDGLLLPRYRLPTEAEWEYAALGLIGNSYQELVTDRKTYPWNGHYVRNDDNGGRFYGGFNANFVRGRGDLMGVAGALNDNGDITTPVYQYAPNDYGLYNMAGNVSEWVMDVYRPMSPEDKGEFRPFRGNVYKTQVKTSDGLLADKHDQVTYDVDGLAYFLGEYQKRSQGKLSDKDLDLIDNLFTLINESKDFLKTKQQVEAMDKIQTAVDLISDSDEAVIAPDLRDGFADYIIDTPGNMQMRDVNVAENIDRRNYQESDNIDFRDGDFSSSIKYFDSEFEGNENRMYDWGTTTLINNRSRVYKGGSWRDRAYWIVPGTRRYLDERRATSTLGFRCAMTRVGSPVGFSSK